MLNNLPSASRRPPLATGRALLAALAIHGALAAAIYVSGAIGGSKLPPGAPDTLVSAVPAEPGAPGRQPYRQAARAPAEALATPKPGETPEPAAAGRTPSSLSLADTSGAVLLSQSVPGILLDAPDTMLLGESYEVRVSLPPGPKLPQPRNASGDTLAASRRRNGISPVRQATLAGVHVVIEPRTPALQLADSAASTTWRWMVVPREAGKSRLAAEVSVVHYRDGEERIAYMRGLQKNVHVRASWAQQVSGFFAANWFWVLLFTLASTTGWLRSRFRS